MKQICNEEKGVLTVVMQGDLAASGFENTIKRSEVNVAEVVKVGCVVSGNIPQQHN